MTRDQYLKTLEELRHRSTEALDELTDSLIREAIPTPEKREEWREEFRKKRERRDQGEEIQDALVKDVIGGLDRRFEYFETCFLYLVNPKLRPRAHWERLLSPGEVADLDRYLLLLGDEFATYFRERMRAIARPGESRAKELRDKILKSWEKLGSMDTPERDRTALIAEIENTPLSTVDYHVRKLSLRSKKNRKK